MNFAVTSMLFCAALGADAEPAQKIAPPGIRLPVPPAYEVLVQKESLLPKGDRPDATVPVGDGRIAVSIQPERNRFPANGPLAITVTLKNVSEKPLSLWGLESLGGRSELVIAHVKSAAQVKLTGPGADAKSVSFLLEPGKSVERTLIVRGKPIVVPINPRPIVPLPLEGNPRRTAVRDPKEAAAEKVDGRIRPGFPAPATIAPLGTVRMRLLLEFVAPPEKGAGLHWTGKLASDPIDLELTEPAAPPPAGAGPPTTRAQAIALAHPAAEAALNAVYQPLEPVRPTHTGNWISEPEKSAEVKDRDGGGWTVSWTHTPKGKGHSHHVMIDVSPTGQATVREVFAGYSNR